MAPSAETARGEAGAGQGRFRLLVIATESVGADELEAELRRHAAGREAQVRIVAPAIVETAFQHAAGDVDDAISAAQGRLADSAERLRGESIEVESFAVGDSDPMLAIGDALRTAPADEILLVTHPDEEAGWMEEGLFDKVCKEVEQPVTHVTVTNGDGRHQAEEVEHSEGGTDPSEAAEVDTPSRSMPKLTARDVTGLVVATFGTVALFAIAANCISEPADTRTTACTAQLLIAGAIALMNIAHVVGLVLFSSVGYRGIAERFFSRFTMIATPLAIAAVLIIGATD